MKRDTQITAQTASDLEKARRILAHPVNVEHEEWMMVATLVGAADLAVRNGQASADLKNLLQEVLAEFREISSGFADPAFLHSTRAARRRNPDLFSRLA